MPKGPGPYLNTVPKEGGDPIMKTVDFDTNQIGANNAGKPTQLREGIGGLQHYGTSPTGTGG